MTTITLARGLERMTLSPVDRATRRAAHTTLDRLGAQGWVLLGVHHTPRTH